MYERGNRCGECRTKNEEGEAYLGGVGVGMGFTGGGGGMDSGSEGAFSNTMGSCEGDESRKVLGDVMSNNFTQQPARVPHEVGKEYCGSVPEGE